MSSSDVFLPSASPRSVAKSAELGYFVAAGCFACSRVEATPITWYLAPGMQTVPGKPRQKKKVYFTPRNVIFT